MAETLAPRTVGELFGQGFRLTFANLVPLVAIHLVFQGPPALLAQMSMGQHGFLGSGQEANEFAIPGFLFAMLLSLLLYPLSQAACIMIIANHFLDRPRSLSAAFGVALRRLLPLLFVGLTKGLLVGLCYLPGFIIVIVGLAMGDYSQALAGVLVVVGVLLCSAGVGFGIVVLLAYGVAEACVVVEREGVFAALRRSTALTKGSRIRMFTLALLVILVTAVVTVPIAIAGSIAGVVAQSPYATWATNVVTNMVSGVLFTVFLVVVYFDLRVRSEGFDLDNLAELVDVIAERSGIPRSPTATPIERYDDVGHDG